MAVRLGNIAVLDERAKLLDEEIARRAKTEDVLRHVMTTPSIGPITATALTAMALPPAVFH